MPNAQMIARAWMDDAYRADLLAQGIEAEEGNASDPRVLAAANLPQAALLYVAIPESFEAGQIVQQTGDAVVGTVNEVVETVMPGLGDRSANSTGGLIP